MIVSLTDYKPSERYDNLPWTEARIEGSDAADGVWATVETITLDPVDADPANPLTRNFTTDDATGDQSWFRVVFLDEANNEEPTNAVSIARRAFATVEDVEVRMARGLTDPEQALSWYVVQTVTGLIMGECGKDQEWLVDLDPVPSIFKALCVEKAISALANPNQLRSHSETLGARQDARTFRDGDGVFLTEDEKRMVRAIVNAGSGSAWVEVGSILDTLPVGYLDGTGLPSWVVTLPDSEYE